MTILESSAGATGWKKSFLCLAVAVICFNLAYASIKFPAAGFLIVGYAYFLVQLVHQPTVRRAFYFGLAAGFGCAAGQAYFFCKIFSAAAIVLWLVFAFWIGLFTAICCGGILRWGKSRAVWLIPFVWTGTEYFRSELYYLKFSWLNVGYAFSYVPHFPFYAFGMYGAGFLVFSLATLLVFINVIKRTRVISLGIILILLVIAAWLIPSTEPQRSENSLQLVGVQMEFPPENVIPKILNQAAAKYTNAPIFVMSEYTLEGGVPDSLKDWCREHSRYLVIGGKDIVTNDVYYDTAFVVGTNGQVIFKQAKCVPIQLFKDGLRATGQKLWDSPWGKIGICICYDLSYTRVTDELVRQGAQMFIIPTMDVEGWGMHEHELHSRVAPTRAAEYDIPIFRVASSGISQAVTRGGKMIAHLPVPDNGAIFSAQLELPMRASLPLDRYFAPVCVAVTGTVTAILLFLTWKGNRRKQNASVA